MAHEPHIFLRIFLAAMKLSLRTGESTFLSSSVISSTAASFISSTQRHERSFMIFTRASLSTFIGFWNMSQLFFLACFASSSAPAAILSSSSADAIPSEIIHSFIFLMGSFSSSHLSLSSFLYLSCEPDVEWPSGCVTSSTWKTTGL